MPFLSLPNSSRRQFLLRTLGGAALLAAGRAPVSGADASRARLALLSDTHVHDDPQEEYRGFRPHDNLEKVAPQVAGFRPDAVVIDGDLARLKGTPGDYRNLKQLLAPAAAAAPICMALGNHDDRNNFRQAFGGAEADPPVKNRHIVVVDYGPVRLLVLDSLIRPDYTPGHLGKAQRDWLNEYLGRAGNKPLLVFVHHTLDDGDGSLLDSDRLLRILGAHSQVKAVLYGHSHRYHYDTLDGLHLINLPAVGYNFRDEEPVGWVEATVTPTGGEFRLRALAGNTEGDGKVRSLAWRA